MTVLARLRINKTKLKLVSKQCRRCGFINVIKPGESRGCFYCGYMIK